MSQAAALAAITQCCVGGGEGREGLKLAEICFFAVWRLEVQDQGASNFGFFRGLAPWLADGSLLGVSSHGLSSVPIHPRCLSVCTNFLSLEGHQSD